MVLRILVGAGLLALGYYVGREIGRTESVREELRKARTAPPPPAHGTTEPQPRPSGKTGSSK